jgi:hypothetical protein
MDGAVILRASKAEASGRLAGPYLLGFESTNTKRDGSWRALKVETVDKRYRVRARRGYRAASK